MTELQIKNKNGVVNVLPNAEYLPFSQEDNVLNISLPALQRTLNYEDHNGKLPLARPVEHHELINSLCNKVVDAGFTPEIESIYIKDSYSRRIGWKDKSLVCPIENYMIDRLICKIVINRNEEDSEHRSSIALSYSERGIEIAMGINVFTCTNFNIFGNKRIATFGPKKMPFKELMELAEAKWIHNIDYEYDKAIFNINALRNKQITLKDADVMFGELFRMSVRKNMNIKNFAPLNQTQVAATVRNFISNEKDIYNMWDFTNSGTQALHIYRNDFQNVLESIDDFNSYTLEKTLN